MKKIFLVAGEASGDLAGSEIMRDLNQERANLLFSGVFGPKMRAFQGEVVLRMEELQIIGFLDVLTHFPSIVKKFRYVLNEILHKNPDLVILIDYPGFNLRLAKRLRKKGYRGKIVQYIAPTVWAWRPSRKKILETYYDALFVLLPFEKECFKDSKLQVEYVGHPLCNLGKEAPVAEAFRRKFSIPEKAALFAFFPGSRPSEIDLNFPQMIEVIRKLAEADKQSYFAISSASPKIQAKISPYLTSLRLGTRCKMIPSQLNSGLMKEADAALAKSGTVVLELALYETPTAVIYKIRAFERWLLRFFFQINLPYFSLPNILLNEEVFREFIRNEGTSEDIAQELAALASNEKRRQAIQEKLVLLPEMLSPPKGEPSTAKKLLLIMES